MIFSSVSNDAASNTNAEFFAPLIFTFPLKVFWPIIFKCWDLRYDLLLLTQTIKNFFIGLIMTN